MCTNAANQLCEHGGHYISVTRKAYGNCVSAFQAVSVSVCEKGRTAS